MLSSFSVFFFPELERFLLHLYRHVRSSAIVGFAFSRGQDPRWTWYDELLRGTGALAELPRPLGYAGIRDPGVLQGLLEAAGFTDTVEHVELTDVWYASPEAWWTSLWTHGSRRPLERMPAHVLADFQEMAMARVRAMAEASGVLEQMYLVYVTGRRA